MTTQQNSTDALFWVQRGQLCILAELIPQTAMRRQTFPTIAARRSTH